MRHEVETNRKTYNTEFDLGIIALFKYPATKQHRLFVFCTPIHSLQTPQQIRQSSNMKQHRARAHIACRTLEFNVNVRYLQSGEKPQHHASRTVHRLNSVLYEETDRVGRFPLRYNVPCGSGGM